MNIGQVLVKKPFRAILILEIAKEEFLWLGKIMVKTMKRT